MPNSQAITEFQLSCQKTLMKEDIERLREVIRAARVKPE